MSEYKYIPGFVFSVENPNTVCYTGDRGKSILTVVLAYSQF